MRSVGFAVLAAGLLASACVSETAETTAVDALPDPSVATGSTSAPSQPVEVTAISDGEAVEIAGQLLESVMNEEQTTIVELVETAGSASPTNDQLRNVFRFAVSTGWLDEIGDCEVDTSIEVGPGIKPVGCEVSSGHPIFGFPESTEWVLHVKGDHVVDATPAPYVDLTDSDEDLFHWIQSERPTASELRCGSDTYEPSEVLSDTTAYPLHPRCGSYLIEMMEVFYSNTDPDHPVAVWERFESAWNDEEKEEILSLVSDDIVWTTRGRTFTGIDEFTEWVEFEFESLSSAISRWEDYEVYDDTVYFTVSWRLPTQADFGPGFRGVSTVRDGLIHIVEY